MSTGRTKQKYWRCYVDGYDLSGYSRSIGPLEVTYDEADLTAYMSDAVKGYLPNHAHINAGTLNAVFDDTATVGLHALSVTPAGTARDVMVPIGIRAAPADGDPVFCGKLVQKGYQVTQEGGAVMASIPWSGWAANAISLMYGQPFGQLLHASAATVAVNAAAGFLSPTGAATAKGGLFMYQVFAGNGTATLSVEDSDDWDDAVDYDLTVATSGLINCAVPTSGLVVSSTLDIREGLRWQIAFTTANTVTFACAFMRVY